MKTIFSTILFVLFLTGCSSLNLSKNSIEPKDKLIQKADNGNIQAMLMLNKHYNFPYTKEGLSYFSKWYKTIDKNDNANDIYKIAAVYAKYSDMFVNGEEKVINLYNLSASFGKKEAKLQELKFLVKNGNRIEAQKLEEKIINTLSEKQLLDLEEYYSKEYYARGSKRVANHMERRGFNSSFKKTLLEVKTLMYKKKRVDEYHSLVNEIIETKNKKNMFALAEFLNRRYGRDVALKVYKELLKLDSNNDKIYLALAKIYAKGIYKKVKKDETLAIKYAKKAIALGNDKAYIKLLEIYSSKRKYTNEFFALEKKLNNTKDGQFIIVKYYKKRSLKTKAYELLNKMANGGDQEAILELALIIQSKYSFTPQRQRLQEKWQDYINTSKNTALKSEYKKRLFEYKNAKAFTKTLLKYSKEDIKEGNILTLRKLIKTFKYKNPEESFKYLQLAAKAGDTKSIRALAQAYAINKKHRSFEKASSTMEILVKKGDNEATKLLGELYLNPPKAFKKFADARKGVEYYVLLANKGDIPSIRKLANIYICDTCYNKDVLNYKKGLSYLELLQKENFGRDSATLGWMYNMGKGVKQDLLKAKKYYEKAKKEGFSAANYYLAWLYYKDKNSKIEPIKLDYKKALGYLKEGVKQKRVDCINLMGVFYQNGYGVKKDIEKAATYYKRVAKYNNMASYRLGLYYKKKKDFENAEKYFKLSSKRKNSASMIQLGIIYERGLLGEVLIKKAINEYKRAYRNNRDSNAAYNLGLIYHYGKGNMEKDFREASYWYKKSKNKKVKKQLALLHKNNK